MKKRAVAKRQRQKGRASVSKGAPSPNRTTVDVGALSIAERIQLAEDLWDSIPASSDELELTEEQKAELDRRLEDFKRNPDAGEPWDVVKARIQERLTRGN